MSFQRPFRFRFPACAWSTCAFFCFLIYFPVLLPSFGCICGFRVIFLVLFYFPVLLACNKALSSLSQIMSPFLTLVLTFDVVLAFGSRRKSFGMRVFPLSGSRNNSYPCIWLSLSDTNLVLNMKFSHGLANWPWLWIVFVILTLIIL